MGTPLARGGVASASASARMAARLSAAGSSPAVCSATARDLGATAPAPVRAALLRRYGPLQWFRDQLLRRRGITPTFLEITVAGPGST